MDLTFGDVADDDFLLLPETVDASARYTVDDGYLLFARSDGTHVLMTRTELEAFAERLWDEPLAPLLAGLAGTPAADAADLMPPEPHGRTVVLHDGKPAGFYDPARRPFALRKRPADEEEEQGGAARWFCADIPPSVVAGETAPILVWIDESGDDTLHCLGEELTVIAEAGRGLELEEPSEGTLRAGGPLRFGVTGRRRGTSAVTLRCFRGADAVATIRTRCAVVASPRRGGAATSAQPLRISVEQPDLTLFVDESSSGDRLTLRYLVSAHDPDLRLTHGRFGPVVLHVDPRRYFEAFFRDVEQWLVDQDDATAVTRYGGVCASLYEQLLPADLREVIWKHRKRFRSVQVVSYDEAWIPWEILKLSGGPAGLVADGPFLCEEYILTRWCEGERRLRLRLEEFGVVCDPSLPAAQKERLYLHAMTADGGKVHDISPNLDDLIRAFARNTYDVWHYCGHAEYAPEDPARSFIVLRKEQTFMPMHLSGRARNFGRNGPLVFFNACHSGRAGLSLTGIGGWSTAMIGAGAAAFIGPQWSVTDEAAYRFAQRFYDGLLRGETAGVASLMARRTVRQLGDSSWLAYTVHADPFAAAKPAGR